MFQVWNDYLARDDFVPTDSQDVLLNEEVQLKNMDFVLG